MIPRADINFPFADEWSAKASAAELRGLSSMFDAQVSDICVPLLSLLDYMGFRLIAISLLPIKGTLNTNLIINPPSSALCFRSSFSSTNLASTPLPDADRTLACLCRPDSFPVFHFVGCC